MMLSAAHPPYSSDLPGLFDTTFTASEGPEEGALISALVGRLISETRNDDLRIFTARDEAALLGAICLSRLAYRNDARHVLLLSPVAIAPEHQGKGIGQALIRHGLDALRTDGVDIVITYGDPAFYGRVGFLPLDEKTLAAPYPLTQPEGWIGQSLNGSPIAPIEGAPRCVRAFEDPALW